MDSTCRSRYTPMPRHSGAFIRRPVTRSAAVSSRFLGALGVNDAIPAPTRATATRPHQRFLNEIRTAKGKHTHTDLVSRHGDRRIPMTNAIRGSATGSTFRQWQRALLSYRKHRHRFDVICVRKLIDEREP